MFPVKISEVFSEIENLPDKEFQKAIVEFIEGGDYSNIEPVTVAAIIGLISATVWGGLGLGKTALERKKAKEEAKRFDYRKLLEEKKKEITGEDLTEFEKDLKVYLHEKETMDKRALEGLFSEKREEGAEE